MSYLNLNNKAREELEKRKMLLKKKTEEEEKEEKEKKKDKHATNGGKNKFEFENVTFFKSYIWLLIYKTKNPPRRLSPPRLAP